MALFLPGASKCAITGRILGEEDEVAFFPAFLHADPLIQKCSDGVIDLAGVRGRPEFQQIISLYESLIHGKIYLFRDADGAVIRRPLGQAQLVFFPLLLSINAPESSVRNLFTSDFSNASLYSGQGRFENFGLGLEYSRGQLSAQSCPTKYLPSKATPDVIHRLNRRGKVFVEPFLRFIAAVRPTNE